MTPALDPERYSRPLALGGVALGAAALASWGPASLPLAAFALTFLLLACYSRIDGFLLLGPYVRFELVRQSRKQRVHLWRTLLLFLAGLPVLGVALFAFGPVPPANRIPANMVTTVAEGVFTAVYFYAFLTFSSIAVQFVATAVVEDREAKRLDFTLVTDLRNREIVLGKSIVRTFGALAYMLPTLPYLILLPALFGIDPYLVLFATALGVVSTYTMAGAAALGSVSAPTKRLAGREQGRIIVPYGMLGIALGQVQNFPAVWFWPGNPMSTARFSVGDAIDWFNIGNPVAIGFSLSGLLGPGGVNLGPFYRAFPSYAAFHFVAGSLLFLLAVRKLRTTSAELAGEPPPPEAVAKAKARPAVTDWPIVWKEMYCIPTQWRTRGNVIAGWIMIFIMAVAPALLFLADAVADIGLLHEPAQQAAHFLPCLAAVLGPSLAMHFAGMSVARERERDTLTNLLMTDLRPRDILVQKFVGMLFLNRATLYWLIIIGIPAILNRGLEWYAFLGLLVTYALGCCVCTAFGLTESVRAATAEKAGRAIGIRLAAFLLVAMLIAAVMFAVTAGGGTFPTNRFLPFGVGLLPLFNAFVFGYAFALPPGMLAWWVAGMATGWVAYGLVGWWLWRVALRRFEAECGVAALDVPAPAVA